MWQLPAVALVVAGTTGLLAAASAPFWLAVLMGAGMGAATSLGAGLRGAPAALERDGAPAGPAATRDAVRAALELADALPAALLVVARNGRVLHVNPAARAMLPRLGMGVHVSHLIRAPAFAEGLAASLRDGRPRRFEFTADPGRERVFDARIAPLPRDGVLGPEPGVIVQIEDRTEARRAEQLRSDFIANASHELRTPLASIIGYVETLQHHARDDPEARERFLVIIAREANRMQRLVADLMSLSRIELSEHVRPEEQCALHTIAAEAAAALQPQADAEDVRLELALAGEGPLVIGDRDQLAQVFANLIDNAIKYAGPGARVRIVAAPPSPAFPNRVGVTIEDNGPGIAREHLPRLTERFYRADVGLSRHRGGTGLGLAIVKHILNRHGGRLEIASSPGQGSAFTVWLPLPTRATALPAEGER